MVHQGVWGCINGCGDGLGRLIGGEGNGVVARGEGSNVEGVGEGEGNGGEGKGGNTKVINDEEVGG